TKPIILENNEKVYPNSSLNGIAKPDVLPAMYEYYIVGDDVYNNIEKTMDEDVYYVWNAAGSKDDKIEAGQALQDEYLGLFAMDSTIYEIQTVWSPIMFVGLFIGIVIFVSAGSFLYFRLYTDLDDDKEKFTAISKIGLTTKELNKVISKQMALLFFAPIVVAVIHGAVALTALSHLFNYNFVYEA